MLETHHRFEIADARRVPSIPDGSVDLVVTSPPYPMIEMWDETFAQLSGDFREALEAGEGGRAFEACHRELDRVWQECFRVLRDGGIACVNIGDATRTIDSRFEIHPNHARALMAMRSLGFTSLPDILWRKPTNAPNKFMGSGMLPAGAYVTYEHEYILILRKGEKRAFDSAEEKAARRRSAYFWEERNTWFSDVWSDLRGTSQALCDKASRDRSGAFPFELAYRLINMYSVQGDVVLDPFGGTGTTAAASVASGRSSVSIEIDSSLVAALRASVKAASTLGRARARARLAEHLEFVVQRSAAGKALKHRSSHYDFPVVTAQERDLVLLEPTAIEKRDDGTFIARHQAAAIPANEVQTSLFEE